LLAGVCNPAAFRSSKVALQHGKVPDNMQGRRWMEVGHGEGCWAVLAQRKPERKRGRRVRVGEEEEERPGRKAGGGSRDGWRRDRVFKREGNAAQRPGAPLLLGVLRGTAHPGDGLSPALLGGLEEAGGQVLGLLSPRPAGMQDAGAWVRDGRRVLGLGGSADSPAPNGLILQPRRRNPPRPQGPAASPGTGPKPIQGGKGQFAPQFRSEPATFVVSSCSVLFPFKFLVQNIENGNTVFSGHKYLENTSAFFFFFSTLTHTKAKNSRTTRRQQGGKKKNERDVYRLHFCTSRGKRNHEKGN